MTTSSVVPVEKPKRKWLKRLLIAGGIFAVLLGVVIGGLLLHYDDAWFKAQILTELKALLERDCELGNVHVSFTGASAEISDLSILNNAAIYSEKHTLKIGKLNANVSLLPLLFSSGKKIQGVNVTIERPEIVVEHRGVWPMEKSNIDDLVKKFLGGPPGVWPKNSGLQALDYTLTVRDGTFRYRDSDKELGESRIQKFELTAKQDGLGQPANVRSNLELLTPASDKAGSAQIEGHIDWINAAGLIDPNAFKNMALSAKLNELDIPYILRHLHIHGNLADGQYQWAPGRPFSGVFQIDAPTIASVRTTANIETDGAISIIQHGKRIAGDVPGQFDFDLNGGWKNGTFQGGPSRFSTKLVAQRKDIASDSAAKLLDLKINAGAEQGSSRKFEALFKARLTELFATDAGVVLKLKDQIGGELDGSVNATLENDGHFAANGKLNTKNGYVAYEGVRQPSSMDITFNAAVTPNEDGIPENAAIDFTASADSFSIKSLKKVQLTALNNPQKLSALAELQLHAGGREFWKQFGPLLNVLNLGTPLEEQLDGEMTVSGGAGSIRLKLDASLQRQSQSPEPIRFNVEGSYDGNALADADSKPFLILNGQIKSADKAINIAFDGLGTRSKNQQIFELKEFKNTSDLDAVTRLNKRFAAYLSVFPGPNYKLAGYINQTGHSKLVREIDAAGKEISSVLTLATELQLPELAVDGPPAKTSGPLLKLREKGISLNLGVTLKQSGTNGTLALQPLKLKSDSLSLEGELAEADLGKLKTAFNSVENTLKNWIDSLPASKVDMQVTAAAIQHLKENGLLPNEPLYAGDIALKAQYDPVTAHATISRIEVNNPIVKLKGSSDEFSLRDLAALSTAQGSGTARLLQALPTLAISIQSKPEFAAELKKLGYKEPSEWPLNGDLSLIANYDATAHVLRLSELEFNGDAGKVSIKAPTVDMNKVAAVYDQKPGQFDINVASAALPDFAMDIALKGPIFAALRDNFPQLKDSGIAGELALKAQYAAAADHLNIELLRFNRAEKTALPLTQVELSGVAALRQILPKLNDPALAPIELLSAFPQGILLKSATANPPELWQYLMHNKIGGTLPADAILGVYACTSPLVIQNAVLKHGAAAGSLELSLDAKTPLEWHPRPEPGKEASKASAATLGGSWGFAPDAPLKVTLATTGFSAQGRLVLDGASLTYTGAEPSFTYNKPAATQCRVTFSVSQGDDGVLKVPALDVAGGPLGFAVENLTYNTAAAQPLATVDKIVLREGPMAGTLSAINLDMARDHLRAQAAVEQIDLAKFIPPKTFPQTFQLAGTLGGVTATYDGRISAFDKGLKAEDKLGLHCARTDIRASGTAGGKTATAALSGELNAEWTNAESKALNVAIGEQKLQVAVKASPRMPGDDLLKALQATGLPLAVQVTCNVTGPLDAKALGEALDTISASMATPGASSSGMGAISRLQVTASLNAPQIALGSQSIQKLQIPSLVLSDLNMNIAEAHGIVMQDGEFTLSKTIMNLATEAYSGDVQFKNLDLHALLTPGKPKKDEYEILGRATGTAQVSGTGLGEVLKNAEMKSDITVSGLIAQKNGGKADSDMGKKGIGLVGDLAEGVLGQKGLGREGRKINWLTDMYGDNFGLFLNKIEFEDIHSKVTLAKGIAKIANTELVGRGNSAGLQIDAVGGVELSTEKLQPNITLRLIKIPAGTQKVLRIDQLDQADRDAILAKFASGAAVKPVVLTGTLNNIKVERQEDIAKSFNELDNEIDAKIQAKGPKQPANTQPGTQQSNPPPKQPAKKGLFFDLLK